MSVSIIIMLERERDSARYLGGWSHTSGMKRGEKSKSRTIRVALICPKNHKNAPKIHKKWPKIEHFSNTFDNIYLTKTLRSLKIGYPSGPALLLTVDSDNKLLPSVFEAF